MIQCGDTDSYYRTQLGYRTRFWRFNVDLYSMIFNDPSPRFKGHTLFEVETAEYPENRTR